MIINDTYDVVVVGAGPAGSMCAQKLAKEGKSVLLIERDKMPRNKVCTGMVAEDSIKVINKEIGSFPQSLCVYPYSYKGFRYKMANGVPIINMGIDSDEVCYSVKRSEFDFWLSIEASKAGAQVVDTCAFVDIVEKNSDNVTIKVLLQKFDGSREYKVIKTSYLIAADGMNSMLRTKLFPERKEIQKCYCRQEYYVGSCDLDPEYYYYFRYNKAVDEPIWTFRKDDCIVIGFVAYPADVLEEKRKKILDYFVTEHNLKMDKLKFSEVCCESTNYTVLKMKKGNLDFVYGCEDSPILFVGEAGEMMDSMSAGIAIAMESGCHAAEAIRTYEENKKENLCDVYREVSAEMIERISASWLKFYNKFGRFF